MRKYLLCILAAISLLIVLFGCSKPTENEVGLEQEFTLSIGQSAVVVGENFSIKFVEVISDSRCPKGATCIWAGEASCLIEITDSESTYRKVLTQSGLSGPSNTSFTNYEITFDLQPYPEMGKEINKKDYHLRLVISKIELCDGTPSQVEANLDYWVDTVQRFCPWSAKIVRIEDFR